MFYVYASLLLLLSLPSWAQNMDGFHERFAIQKNAAGEKVIVDKSLSQQNGLVKYVQNLATYLKPSETEFTSVFSDATCKGIQYENPNEDIVEVVDTAIHWMQKTHIGDVLTDAQFLEMIQKMNTLGDQFVKDPDYQVMANLDNPKYFYKKAAGKYFLKKLSGLVENYFTSGNPYLKVVTFISKDYANWVFKAKAYHQNYLKYYLETRTATELGLTESERLKALSSIEDSKLSFGIKGILISKKIQKDFEGYGVDKLAEAEKDAEKRWKKYNELFEERLEKADVYYSLANYQGTPIYLNLAQKKSLLDRKPSFAFDATCPNFQYENRRRYELARVALSIFPIPYADKLVKLFTSKYQNQSLNEGILWAHLEANKDFNADYVRKQSVNPLLQ